MSQLWTGGFLLLVATNDVRQFAAGSSFQAPSALDERETQQGRDRANRRIDLQ
jgi:hypothetical protein